MTNILQSTPMARALLGEREALYPVTGHEDLFPDYATSCPVPQCFSPSWLGAKPHYADPAVGTPDGWMVWTYLPSGDPSWVADCPTYAEANALAESLSAPTLWDAEWLNSDFCVCERAGQMRLPIEVNYV